MRIVSVLFAYACAAVTAVTLVMLLGAFQGGINVIDVFTDLRGFGLLTLTAAIYAFPIAAPVVIATEILKCGDWKIFIGAGAILGALLTIVLTEVPFSSVHFLNSAIFFPIAIMSALVYWLVAWHWMSRESRKRSEVGGTPA